MFLDIDLEDGAGPELHSVSVGEQHRLLLVEKFEQEVLVWELVRLKI